MNGFFPVLTVVLRDLRHHPGTAVASIISIAVGVNVFVSIHLAGTAARSGFASTVEAVAGRATHQVVREAGIDEYRLVRFLELPGVLAAQPVVEGLVATLSVERGASTLTRTAPP